MTDREAMKMALKRLTMWLEDFPDTAVIEDRWAVEALRQALAQPEQEPVHFLANGVRYKVTHQGYYGCSIAGLPENLNGQWVALVEATDSKHLNCIPPQESTKPEQEQEAYDAPALYKAKAEPEQEPTQFCRVGMRPKDNQIRMDLGFKSTHNDENFLYCDDELGNRLDPLQQLGKFADGIRKDERLQFYTLLVVKGYSDLAMEYDREMRSLE